MRDAKDYRFFNDHRRPSTRRSGKSAALVSPLGSKTPRISMAKKPKPKKTPVEEVAPEKEAADLFASLWRSPRATQ